MGSHGYLTHCRTMVGMFFSVTIYSAGAQYNFESWEILATLWFTERKYAEIGGVSIRLSLLSFYTNRSILLQQDKASYITVSPKFRAENSFVEVGLLLLPHPEPDVWNEEDLQGCV